MENLSKYLLKIWRSYLYASVVRLSLTVEKAFLIRFICYAYILKSFIFTKSLNNNCDNSFDCDSTLSLNFTIYASDVRMSCGVKFDILRKPWFCFSISITFS